MWKIMRFSNLQAWEHVLVHPKTNQDFVKEHNEDPFKTDKYFTVKWLLMEVFLIDP